MSDAVVTVESVWDRVVALATELEPDDWRRPTPCTDWDVKDLLGHMSGLQRFFDAGVRLDPPEGWKPPPEASPIDAWTGEAVAARRGWRHEQVLDELRQARDGHRRRAESVRDWSAPTLGPLGETTEENLLAVRMFDLWVHLQDLRLALDLPIAAGDDSPAAITAYRYVTGLVPWMGARRCEFPDGTTMRLRLVAPLDFDRVLEIADGRGRWNDEADPGSCAVEADPAAFTLLAAGRGTPRWWREEGLLSWSGGRAEEFVARARLLGR